MRRIICEDCKKSYDYDKEEFCPRCGAYNQPTKTWSTDSQGNVIRVDGLNESTHAKSFAHREVHKEKSVRKTTGLDWTRRAQPKRPVTPPRPTQRTQSAQKQQFPERLKMFFWLLAIILLLNLILPVILPILFALL